MGILVSKGINTIIEHTKELGEQNLQIQYINYIINQIVSREVYPLIYRIDRIDEGLNTLKQLIPSQIQLDNIETYQNMLLLLIQLRSVIINGIIRDSKKYDNINKEQ